MFVLSLTGLRAQDTALITLHELIKQVEFNFPAVATHQLNIMSLQSKADGTSAWMAPTFSAGLMRFPYNLQMLNEQNNPMNQAGIGLSFQQMFPVPSIQRAGRSYYESLTTAEKNKLSWTQNGLRREAKLLYYYRFASEQKKILVNENREVLKLMIETSEQKFSNNRSLLQTILKAKARLSELETMLLMLDGVIAECNIGINTLLARDPSTPFTIESVQLKDEKRFVPDTGLVHGRSDIAAMNSSIMSMGIEKQMMQLNLKPTFGIRAEHMTMFGMPDQWSVMGMVTIPIAPWSSGMYKNDVKAAEFQILSMEKEKHSMQLMAGKMIAEKAAMLQFEREQYRLLQDSVIPAYADNFQVNRLAYGENKGELFILLDAWEMLLMKKMELIDKFYLIKRLEADYEYESEIK